MDALEAMQLFLGSARPAAAPAQEELTAAPPAAPPANSEAPLAALLCVSDQPCRYTKSGEGNPSFEGVCSELCHPDL